MPRHQQQTFDLDSFDRNRSEYLSALYLVIERIQDAAQMGMSELQLGVMIKTVGNLCTSHVRSLDQCDLRPVDWTEHDWQRELRCKRTVLFKCLAVAKTAGVIDGSIGQLVLRTAGVRTWLSGELPDASMRSRIDAAKQRSGPSSSRGEQFARRTEFARRTDQFATRTDEFASRTDTYISNNTHTDPDPDPARESPSNGLANRSGSESGAGSAPVFLDEELPECMLGQPEIDESLHRSVDPLPPTDEHLRGAFVPLSDRDLGDTKAMVLWFRRQLAAPDPVITGSTEAHLLIAIAIGLHAAAMRPEEIQRSRVAVFVAVLRRRAFFRIRRQLPKAREQLDQLIAAAGDVVTRQQAREQPC